jgi:tetratricopeptide (TPR) repeat protein
MNDQEKISQKISEFKKALAQDPKSMVFVPLAGCYIKSEMLDDALETALKGTWELPDYSPGFVAVARIYALRQSPAKAIDFFKKAIEIDPSCLDAYKGLARIYRAQGDIDSASKLLTNAIFLFPHESSLNQMLVSLAPVSATPSKAVHPPEDLSKPIATATLAEIYIKQGLYDKALEVYREIYVKTQSPVVAQKIAEIEMLTPSAVASAAPAPPVPEIAATPVAESPPVVATSKDSGSSSRQRVLDTLDRMLASIQLRRNRV